jgi:UrcA family protein
MNIQNQNTLNTVRMTLVAVAALSATMLAGVTHAAGSADEVATQAVIYKDLNLNSSAGVQVLYHRIQGAANQVCGEVDARDLKGMSIRKACVEHAISSAVAAVNAPMLTRVYLAKSVGPAPKSLPIAQVR